MQRERLAIAVILNLIAVGALNFMGTNARAVDAITRTPTITRTPAITRTTANARIPAVNRTLALKRQVNVQMSACMTKRMGADRVITYYYAMKLCQDKWNRQLADPASHTLLASVTPAMP